MLALLLFLQAAGAPDADTAAMQCTMNGAFAAERSVAAADLTAARGVDECLRSYAGDPPARAAARARLIKMAYGAITQARARSGAR